MSARDTIFAVSSGAGRSAISVMRISGPRAGSLLEDLSGRLPLPRNFAVRTLRDHEDGELLDRAVVVWLPAPRSFTGEDCAELHLHGSAAVLKSVMAALSRAPGVRPAEAGEFTRRAFLNGKLDLVEAEGLADLLEARTSGQRRQALRHMSGQASSIFDSWRQQLLQIRADIEAVVDFSDEPGVAEEASPGIEFRIRSLRTEIASAIALSATAEVIRDGVRVVLAGRPNTGKSSLLNALTQRDTAIVSEYPGTTRDAIEVTLDLDGVPVVLTDTAGLRDSVENSLEGEGIRRSRKHISGADVLIWVCSEDIVDSEVVESGIEPDMMVQNKSDLHMHSGLPRNELFLTISALKGQGLDHFIARLSSLVKDRFGDVESAVIVSARQKSAAAKALQRLEGALRSGSTGLEVTAEEVRLASEEIGRITGRVDVEEWLGAIFSRFCIGK